MTKSCGFGASLPRATRILKLTIALRNEMGSLTRCRALTNLCRLGKELGAVFPRVEVRHLHAVIVLAEELNFTRAADRSHITQSGFSKQINEVEALHRFQLFIRTNKRNVELTEMGRIFVEEARLALWCPMVKMLSLPSRAASTARGRSARSERPSFAVFR